MSPAPVHERVADEAACPQGTGDACGRFKSVSGLAAHLVDDHGQTRREATAAAEHAFLTTPGMDPVRAAEAALVEDRRLGPARAVRPEPWGKSSGRPKATTTITLLEKRIPLERRRRRKEQRVARKKTKTITCTKCGTSGHNARSCESPRAHRARRPNGAKRSGGGGFEGDRRGDRRETPRRRDARGADQRPGESARGARVRSA